MRPSFAMLHLHVGPLPQKFDCNTYPPARRSACSGQSASASLLCNLRQSKSGTSAFLVLQMWSVCRHHAVPSATSPLHGSCSTATTHSAHSARQPAACVHHWAQSAPTRLRLIPCHRISIESDVPLRADPLSGFALASTRLPANRRKSCQAPDVASRSVGVCLPRRRRMVSMVAVYNLSLCFRGSALCSTFAPAKWLPEPAAITSANSFLTWQACQARLIQQLCRCCFQAALVGTVPPAACSPALHKVEFALTVREHFQWQVS